MSDESKRRIYDEYGEEGLKDDKYIDSKKGENIYKDLDITLEEAYNGVKKELEYNRNILCQKCKGKGYINPSFVDCVECDGRGFGIKRINSIIIQTKCPLCQGLKKIIKEKCEECDGKKYKNVKNKIIIEIERGIPDGYEYLEKGEGNECLEYEAGDLLITIHIKKELNIERKGADLFYSCNISLLESLTGFKVLINHLNNKKIMIKNKPGELIKHGMIKYVGKFGMPFFKSPDKYGNIYIKFNVIYPEKYPKNKMKKSKKFLKMKKLIKLKI